MLSSAPRRVIALFLALSVAACATAEPVRKNSDLAVLVDKKKPAAPAQPAFRQADILGRDAESLDALLGAPALVRTEGAGEFRRYSLAECALIVILYTNESGQFSAGHLDASAKASGDEKPDLDRCLARGLAAPVG